MLWVFAPLLLILAFSGCASLPNLQEQIAGGAWSNVPLEIVGPEGKLPADETLAILARLRQKAGPTDILGPNLAFIQSISGEPLYAGNKVTLLVDKPAAYASMFEAVGRARESINLDTYIFHDNAIGRALASLLLQKKREGVQVNLIYDAVGAWKTSGGFFDLMKEGGILAVEFNPLHSDLRSLIHRDHRKILVVDGRTAFTGSINIGALNYDLYGLFSGKKDSLPWRETDVQIEGPAVAALQRLFLETWEEQKGPPLPQRDYFPRLDCQGDDLVRIIGSHPMRPLPLTFTSYVSAFLFAGRSIHLTNPYFVPDGQTLHALLDAARRGVDVRIILPHRSDHNIVLYAGEYDYRTLLEAGVRLYERREAVLHAKTAVIDGVWSAVGSTNLDHWSFLRNYEVNAVIISPEFALKMEGLFAQDLADSDEIRISAWRKRAFSDRAMQWLGHLIRYWL